MTKFSEIRISHESHLPLHVQLSNQISYFIKSGKLQPGGRLPSELELHSALNISRTTIRHAFREVEHAGLIQRIPGKGTFVAHHTAYNTPSSSRLILFLVNEFSSEFECRLLSGIERVARSQGYQMGLYALDAVDGGDPRHFLRPMLSGKNVGAIIWPHIHFSQDTELVQLISESYTPTVMVDRVLPGLDCDYISSDNYHGAAEATEYLIGLGHHEIVFLSHKYLSSLPVAERMRGYRDALNARGNDPLDPWIVDDAEHLSPDFVIKHGTSKQTSIVQTLGNRLRDASPRPTAIFAVNDYIALVALYAARFADIKVPDELSIVGFDDNAFARHLAIPLTTVAQDTTTLGKRAAELLIERLEGYHGQSRWENIPVELRVRKSTAAVNSIRNMAQNI